LATENDKFVHVKAHGSGRAVGSGLGLSFCQQAVKAQGGRIWVENTQGGGTTVHFTLPTAGYCLGSRRSSHPETGHRPLSSKLPVLLSEEPYRYTRFGGES
jgi:hypothetical protein